MHHPRSPTPLGLESHPIGTVVPPHRDCGLSHKRLPAYPGLTHLRFTAPAGSRRGLPVAPPSSDTPPLYDATLIHYAGGRRIPLGIPGAGEYRIELDRVR